MCVTSLKDFSILKLSNSVYKNKHVNDINIMQVDCSYFNMITVCQQLFMFASLNY